MTHHAIKFIHEYVRDHEIQFTLQFSGAIFARDDWPREQWQGSPEMESGKWFFSPIREVNLVINVPRSDWVKNVLEPVGFGSYILMEMPVPSVPDLERWKTALEHLARASQQFALSNDPGVFQYCRAAFESLEGFPKNIFDAVEDGEKRKSVDTLLKEAQQYFHSGRHVSEAGPKQGMFPVDHRDAEFALALAKLFLAYVAKFVVVDDSTVSMGELFSAAIQEYQRGKLVGARTGGQLGRTELFPLPEGAAIFVTTARAMTGRGDLDTCSSCDDNQIGRHVWKRRRRSPGTMVIQRPVHPQQGREVPSHLGYQLVAVPT